MTAKFQQGDKVRFTSRVPSYMSADLRRRTRTIVLVCYDSSAQCCFYELGDRGKGRQGYLFRSYQLLPSSTGRVRDWGSKRIRYRRK